ncbi:hypothetical protein [Mycobacteroides abscessus]|uniref:hypothetical protein n=1 Tax=Mycobacteroides abscessus TaxID=36809 RepID=UPI000E67DE4F|nr:hypothetical protein [Mycobacteroides abscessus]RIS37559.1 hypothetical protein D2E48_20875 [Mycobacteroides abscessus]RIS70060.1 hypothetical protein D2E59_16825 [Mycobacteroides abscessus]
MTTQRSQDEAVLVDLRKNIFGSSGLANRAAIVFLADVMRWPASNWVLLDDAPMGFQVAWINDSVIGLATINTHIDPPFTAEVHPLSSIHGIDVAASIVADFPGMEKDLRVSRSMTLRFTNGEAVTIGKMVDDQFVERFVEAVLAAINAEEV